MAWDKTVESLQDGTYELIGPKVQGNPHDMLIHSLVPHGLVQIREAGRTFDNIRKLLAENTHVEGIVWHHEDGRMAKIKRRDFGLPWPMTAKSS